MLLLLACDWSTSSPITSRRTSDKQRLATYETIRRTFPIVRTAGIFLESKRFFCGFGPKLIARACAPGSTCCEICCHYARVFFFLLPRRTRLPSKLGQENGRLVLQTRILFIVIGAEICAIPSTCVPHGFGQRGVCVTEVLLTMTHWAAHERRKYFESSNLSAHLMDVRP